MFWGWQQGFGTFTFAIYCYSNSYKSLGSQPALFDGGWELPVFQVRDKQSNTNKAVPNLDTPISGQHGLLIVLFAECGHGPKTPNDQTKSRQITKCQHPRLRKASFLGLKFFGKASYSRNFFAKLPNRISPTVESKNGQVSNQVAALIWKSVLFDL